MSPEEFWSSTRAELSWKFYGMFPELAKPDLSGLEESVAELEAVLEKRERENGGKAKR